MVVLLWSLCASSYLTHLFADCLDSDQTGCWIQTFAVSIFCICLSVIWETEIFWTTCDTNVYSEFNFKKQDDHARFRNRNLCHFLFIISWLTCKLIFVAGRWGGNREGTENGKTSASRSLSSFWLYCCCFSGVYLIWTSWCMFFYRLMVFLFSSKLIAW